MNCDDVRPLLDPLIDDELPENEATTVQTHLGTCTACRRERDDLLALRNSLQSLGRPNVPPTLHASIITAIDAEVPSHPGRWRPLQAALTHAAAAVFGGLIAYGVLLMPSEQALLTEDILSAHVRALASEHLTQVTTGDSHAVKPWFAGKLRFAPIVVDTAREGFPLLGARVDTLGDRDVAALVYARRAHKINVFVLPVVESDDAAPVAETHKGFAIVRWRTEGFQFWAISDLSVDELVSFSTALEAASKRG